MTQAADVALRRPRTSVAAAGWASLGLLLAYGALVHHGIGPVRDPLAFAWYQPRGSFFRWTATAWLTEDLGMALVGFLLPALILASTVWFATRCATARLLAVGTLLAAALWIYYGIEASGIWRFFHWRGSAVMLGLALVAATALTSPWLASSWERLGWRWQLAVYVPAALGILALMGNATGTDPSLPFALSPWPVVPVFGLERIVPAVCLTIALVALVRVAFSAALAPRLLGPISVAALVAAGLVAVWWGRSEGWNDWRICAVALCLAAVAFVTALGRMGPCPGRHAALGVLLVGTPVLTGMALVQSDYTVTRDLRAKRITDALAAYYQQREMYPDRLEELVEHGLLDEVPTPRVGFRWIYPAEFTYQSFGTSYHLEFSTPGWTQCAYNPPYLDDEEEAEEEDGEDAESEDVGGSWSCPAKPPELW